MLAAKIAELDDMNNKQALKNIQLQDVVDKVMELEGSLQSTVQSQQAPPEDVAEDDIGEDE